MSNIVRGKWSVGALALVLCGVHVDASAARVLKQAFRNPVDVCQGALPVHDMNLRNRPLAIANEGSATAFLSCSLSSPEATNEVYSVEVTFYNRGSSNASANCTLVSGALGAYPAMPAKYFPNAGIVVAGSYSTLYWDAMATAEGMPFSLPNLSCSLAPGMEMVIIRNSYRLEIGS